jgi:plastocyanin
MRLRARRLGMLAPALGLACAGAAPGQPVQRTFRVTISTMAFGPTPAEVRVGDAIEWMNADFLRHTATATDGSFDIELAPAAHTRVILRKPGKVGFRCRYHPRMTGELIVSR